MIKEKWLYYKGKVLFLVYKEMLFDFKLIIRDEIDMFIDVDEEVGKM